jgi:transcriptional repressor NrdR
MRCPACAEAETRVIDSRVIENGRAIRRRRECPRCDHRFSTVEQIELLRLVVVKKDGRREPYQQEKLEGGIRKALEKRPVPEGRVRELLTSIERNLQAEGEEEVTSRAIGAVVMRHLKEVDEVAYIRFASVYKSFRDAETFGTELKRLRKRTRPRRRR